MCAQEEQTMAQKEQNELQETAGARRYRKCYLVV
jgi:hypothetical protein